MTIAPNVVGIFCEDVREEKTGHTIIGIFPDNVEVPHMPGAIPKLGIYVRCHIDPIAETGEISLKLKFPNGEESALLAKFDEATVKKTQADTRARGTPLCGLVLIAVLGMVQLREPGRILAIVTISGEEVLAGSLNFGLDPNPPATASPPPS
jgi:hypothetical protein